MADKKISELNGATTINASDVLVVVQTGETKKCTVETFLTNLPTRALVKEAPESPVSGAISTNKEYSILTVPPTATGNINYTLVAGSHGLSKTLISNVGAAFTAIVTVTDGAGFSTLTFSATGQSVKLVNVDGKWYIMSIFGATNG